MINRKYAGDSRALVFAENLLKIGNGTWSLDAHFGILILIEELCNVANREEKLIEKVYPRIERNN